MGEFNESKKPRSSWCGYQKRTNRPFRVSFLRWLSWNLASFRRVVRHSSGHMIITPRNKADNRPVDCQLNYHLLRTVQVRNLISTANKRKIKKELEKCSMGKSRA